MKFYHYVFLCLFLLFSASSFAVDKFPDFEDRSIVRSRTDSSDHEEEEEMAEANTFAADELPDLEDRPRVRSLQDFLENFSSNKKRAEGMVLTMLLLGFSYEPETVYYLAAPIFLNLCQNLVDSYLGESLSISRYLAVLAQYFTVLRFAKAFYTPLSLFESVALSHLSVFTGWINISSEVGVTWESFFQPLHPLVANVLEQTDGSF